MIEMETTSPSTAEPIYGNFRKIPDLPLQKIFSYLYLDDLKRLSVISKDMNKLVFPSLISSTSFHFNTESEITNLIAFLQSKVFPLKKRIGLTIDSKSFERCPESSSSLLKLFTECGPHTSHLRLVNYYGRDLTGFKENICVPVLEDKLFPNLMAITMTIRATDKPIGEDLNKSYVPLIQSILSNAPSLEKVSLECSPYQGITSLLFKLIGESRLPIKILNVFGGAIENLSYLQPLSLESLTIYARYDLKPGQFTTFLDGQKRTLKLLNLSAFSYSEIPYFTFPKMEVLETLKLSAHSVYDIREEMLPICYERQAPKLKTIELEVGETIGFEFFPFFSSEVKLSSSRSVKEVVFKLPNIYPSNVIACARLFELSKLEIPICEGLQNVWKDLTNLEELTLFPCAEVKDKKMHWIDEIVTGIRVPSAVRGAVLTNLEMENYERIYEPDKSIEMLKKLKLLRIRPSLDLFLMLSDLPFHLVFNKMESLKCIDFCGTHPSFVGAPQNVLDETGKKITLLFGNRRGWFCI